MKFILSLFILSFFISKVIYSTSQQIACLETALHELSNRFDLSSEEQEFIKYEYMRALKRTKKTLQEPRRSPIFHEKDKWIIVESSPKVDSDKKELIKIIEETYEELEKMKRYETRSWASFIRDSFALLLDDYLPPSSQ